MNEVRYKPPSNKWTSDRVLFACLSFFNSHDYMVFEEMHIGGGLADILFISKAMYATEVEVKVSLSDWKADAKKEKWRNFEERNYKHDHYDRSFVKYFWYAVPEALVHKIPDTIPEEAGILMVKRSKYQRDYANVIRPAKARKGVKKVPEKWVTKYHRLSHIRNYYKRFNNLNKEYKYEQSI